MKKINYVLFTVAALASSLISNAQTADDIITKHIDAIGGKDKISNIKSLYVESTIEAMGSQAPSTTTILNGKGYKTESEMMGSKMVTVITDKGGWSINPMSGASPAALTPEQYKSEEDRLYVDALYNYAANGSKVESGGQEKTGDINAFKIKLTNKDNSSVTYFIDPATYYIIKKVKTMSMAGQDTDITTDYSDFKKTDAGLVIPYTTAMSFGSQFSLTSKVKNVQVNKAVDESIFTMPK